MKALTPYDGLNQNENGDFLRWRELGLTPGTTVRIVSHQPLDNLIEVQVGDHVLTLGPDGVAGLSGELDGGKASR